VLETKYHSVLLGVVGEKISSFLVYAITKIFESHVPLQSIFAVKTHIGGFLYQNGNTSELFFLGGEDSVINLQFSISTTDMKPEAETTSIKLRIRHVLFSLVAFERLAIE
jgi:hypothetical protein